MRSRYVIDLPPELPLFLAIEMCRALNSRNIVCYFKASSRNRESLSLVVDARDLMYHPRLHIGENV